jgi:hypothetical protein
MKIHLLYILPFMVCLAQGPSRAADATPAPSSAEKEISPAASDLPKCTDPYIDPLTGTPYIAVHNSTIVESAIFITEFRRAHPDERAFLLLGEVENDLSNAGTIMPTVAFSWKGKVYIHSVTIGDVLIPKIRPEEIQGLASRLHKFYPLQVHYYFQQYFDKQHIPFPSKDEEIRMGDADTFPHVYPNELPGDTEDTQALRVKHRLIKLGLANVKAYQNVPIKNLKGQSFNGDFVTFDFEGFTFLWDKLGVEYKGLAGKTYLPSMVDSIIFSIDYQKANPAEKVFCFLHEDSNKGHMPGLTVSTTVFTKHGQLWFHHLAPGDLPSALSLDDLKDSDKVIAADLAVYAPAIKAFDEQEARLRHQPPSGLKRYLHGYKAPDVSVAGVLAELKKRGVEAKITGDADKPEVLFVWGKQPYTYKPGLGCFAGKPVPTTASN